MSSTVCAKLNGGFFHFLNNALNYMKLSTSLLSCGTLVTLGELVWLVFFAKLATISGEGTAVAVSALSHPVSLWLADRNNFLSLCCLSVGAPNLAASGLSHMKCPIKRYDAGQVGTPVSNHMLARLCIFIGVRLRFVLTATLSACMCSVYASIYPSKQSFIYPSIHPSIHHWYLMRWHPTSRFIGCMQTNPDLIRPHHWNACPRLHLTGFTI